MVAALTDDHKYLTVAVVNATDQEHRFNLGVVGMKVIGQSSVWELSESSLSADNHVGLPQEVFVKEIPFHGALSSIAVGSSTVNIYRFQVAQ